MSVEKANPIININTFGLSTYSLNVLRGIPECPSEASLTEWKKFIFSGKFKHAKRMGKKTKREIYDALWDIEESLEKEINLCSLNKAIESFVTSK